MEGRQGMTVDASDLVPGNLLIVDDNPDNLAVLAGILRAVGHKVRVARSGGKALELVAANPPEIILLDVQMPEMDGYEVCRHLKELPGTSAIPVLFISALDGVGDKVKAFEHGGVDYVTKPFEAAEVRARVESQLQLFRLRRELERRNTELVATVEELIQSRRETAAVFSALSDALDGAVLDGKYRLEGKIAEGGFGAVYRAIHLNLERPVAVKIYRPMPGNATLDGLERFRREGGSASKVDHPNVVTVFDSGVTASGVAYLVMELLHGSTLAHVLEERGSLSLTECVGILMPICTALAEAHRLGIVHRDVKPENIFLHEAEGRRVVKVLDFGIAKLMDASGSAASTTAGFFGTPIYMAPERLRGSDCDGRADVYSLGVMLYRMIAGTFPFPVGQRDTPYSIALLQLSATPRPLREIKPDIPKALESVVMRTLEKDPSRRPTAGELASAFATAVHSPAPETEPGAL